MQTGLSTSMDAEHYISVSGPKVTHGRGIIGSRQSVHTGERFVSTPPKMHRGPFWRAFKLLLSPPPPKGSPGKKSGKPRREEGKRGRKSKSVVDLADPAEAKEETLSGNQCELSSSLSRPERRGEDQFRFNGSVRIVSH